MSREIVARVPPTVFRQWNISSPISTPRTFARSRAARRSVQAEPSEPTQVQAQNAPGASCLRHTGSDWRTVSSNTSLNACVQALYSGTCVRPGDALYGRWGNTTLRLVPRRVEQSPDNNRFRTLVEQDRSCQFPDLR